MTNFSAVILAKNEAENLKELLPTLSFIDEVLVIDDHSTDKTTTIAKKFGAKVLVHSLNSDFASQRQYGLQQAKHPWVLFVDSDERLGQPLIDWLKQFTPQQDLGGYSFKRIDWFYNQHLKHGESGHARVTRLVLKNLGHFVRPVHETWQSQKPIHKTELVIDHYPHPSISAFLEHINFYSDLNAKYWQKIKRPVTVAELMFVPIFKFLYTYFAKLGFLDGPPGFIYSFMMSFHSFLSRAKLLVLGNK